MVVLIGSIGDITAVSSSTANAMTLPGDMNTETVKPSTPAQRAASLFERFIGRFSPSEQCAFYIDRERWEDFEFELKQCRAEEDLRRLMEGCHDEGKIAIQKWLENPQRNLQTAVSDILSSLFDLEEPGYRTGMVTAFQNLRLGERFDEKDYRELHDRCVHAIRKMRQGYRSKANCYGIKWENVTNGAREELLREKLICWDGSSGDYFSFCLAQTMVHSITNNEELPEIINGLFETYYQNISTASTDDEKLEHIVRLCRALEILHAFSDGNQRTIAFALLNKLLLENGFPPAILEDPFMFDGLYSVSEMVKRIREGIDFTRVRFDSEDQLLEVPGEISEHQRGLMVRSAAGNGNQETLQTLLKSGEISEKDRGRAVEIASALGYDTIVSTLLESGKISDQDRGRALQNACKKRKPSIVDMLLESGTIPSESLDRSISISIVTDRGLDILERLLREPRSEQHLKYALQTAVSEGNLDILEGLLQKPESKQYLGEALQVAVKHDNPKAIERLLQEPGSKQYLGEALQVAVEYDNLKAIERLLQEPESKQYLEKALQVAVTYYRHRIVRLLEDHRLDLRT